MKETCRTCVSTISYLCPCFSRFPSSVFIVSGHFNFFFSSFKKIVETP